MKYVALTNGFGIENLSVQSESKPAPKGDEILVRMKAAALNFVDLATIKGQLDPNLKLPFIPVADGSGVIEQVGDSVHGFKPGDRVATLYIPSWGSGPYKHEHIDLSIRPGAGRVCGQLAEYKVFRPHEIIGIPDNLSFAEGATLPIAGLTAWNALAYGGLKAGDTVLLYGTGGVSIFALQFAKASGGKVIITSSDDAKLARASRLGADAVINYRTNADVSEEVARLTARRGVDLVVETVGGPNVEQSLKALRPEGSISIVGFLNGVEANINLITLNLRRVAIRGVSVGNTDDFHDMLAAITENKLKPVIDSEFDLAHTADAFRHLEAGKHFGKVVINL
jgi:NADPH:quinone reductase-like Zn-dependent oxidoreductase